MEVSAIKHMGATGVHGRSPLLRLQSDERLVVLIRRGNHHAFEALVARYQARLLAFCRHMLSSREDAEDVLQEVFAAAFNAMLADNRPINVRPWLYRIARNRSLNHLRRVPALGVDSMDTHFSEHGMSTAEKVHRREDFRLLITDVQDLPETQRTALLLREIDALSYEQIAEAMDNTVPSVKSLLVRARVGLAEAAEARSLDCDDVRFELGEVAEGLKRTSSPVRRHLRTCERCASFRKQLVTTNRALAALMPVGPLFLLKKTLLAHLGTTAAASSSAAAAGGAIQIGVSTAATKTAAGLAVAAIVTAGAVEVKHVAGDGFDRPAAITASAPASAPTAAPNATVPATSTPPATGGGAGLVTQPLETLDEESTAAEEDRAAERDAEAAEAPAEESAAATLPELPDAAGEPTPTPESIVAVPLAGEPSLGEAPSPTALPTPPLQTEAVVLPSRGTLGSPATGVAGPNGDAGLPGPSTPVLRPSVPAAPSVVHYEPLLEAAPAPAPAPAEPTATSQSSGPAPSEPAAPQPAPAEASADEPTPEDPAPTEAEPAADAGPATEPEAAPTTEQEPPTEPEPAPTSGADAQDTGADSPGA